MEGDVENRGSDGEDARLVVSSEDGRRGVGTGCGCCSVAEAGTGAGPREDSRRVPEPGVDRGCCGWYGGGDDVWEGDEGSGGGEDRGSVGGEERGNGGGEERGSGGGSSDSGRCVTETGVDKSCCCCCCCCWCGGVGVVCEGDEDGGLSGEDDRLNGLPDEDKRGGGGSGLGCSRTVDGVKGIGSGEDSRRVATAALGRDGCGWDDESNAWEGDDDDDRRVDDDGGGGGGNDSGSRARADVRRSDVGATSVGSTRENGRAAERGAATAGA